LAAKRLLEQGQYSVTGQPINFPGEQGPRKITKLEAVGKMFGFQPLSATKAWDASKALGDLEDFVRKKKSSLANRWVNARNADDAEAELKVMAEVQEWNKKWDDADKPEYKINLKAAIKSRMKNRPIPKPFRALSQTYSEEYQ
jgi:hypothetical protein